MVLFLPLQELQSVELFAYDADKVSDAVQSFNGCCNLILLLAKNLQAKRSYVQLLELGSYLISALHQFDMYCRNFALIHSRHSVCFWKIMYPVLLIAT